MSKVNGVKVDLVSREKLDGMVTMEKIRLILDSVKEDKVVILQGGLSPEEESRLVEETMTQITPDEFNGVKIERPKKTPDNSGNSSFRKRLGSIVSGESEEDDSDMLVVGPSDKLQTLHKDDSLVSTFISDSD